jgi:hypothetical protein
MDPNLHQEASPKQNPIHTADMSTHSVHLPRTGDTGITNGDHWVIDYDLSFADLTFLNFYNAHIRCFCKNIFL